MKIAVAGGYGVGMSMQLPRLPHPGETVIGGTLATGPGGKGSNQAVAAARLGAEVALFTAVGRDAAASDAHALWASEGVAADAVVVTDSPTMTGFILVDAEGENSIAIAAGALDAVTVSDAERFRTAVRNADMVVVSLELPTEVATRILEIAREEGTRTLLNPAPAIALPDMAWRLVDVLTPNRSEARHLLGDRNTPDAEVAERLASRFGMTVVMTAGAAGAVVSAGGVTSPVAAYPPRSVVDTTGAGDAFTAALAVALCAGASPVAAAEWACAAGAFAVATSGVVPSLARRDDLPHLALHATRD